MAPQPILIVDDSDDDAVLLASVLRSMSLINPLVTLSSGAAAIDYVFGRGDFKNRDQFPFPVLMLVDWKMEPVNGVDVLRATQNLDRDSFAIVVVTGGEERTQMREAYRLGADSFLTKPIRSLDLHYTLRGLKNILFRQVPVGWELVTKQNTTV